VDRAWLAPQQGPPPVPGGTGTGGVAAVIGGTPRSGRIDHGWGWGSYRERGRRAAADIGGARFVAGPAVLAGALHTSASAARG